MRYEGAAAEIVTTPGYQEFHATHAAQPVTAPAVLVGTGRVVVNDIASK